MSDVENQICMQKISVEKNKQSQQKTHKNIQQMTIFHTILSEIADFIMQKSYQ